MAGLDYYGARYYDPVVGVFVSADRMQGNAEGMNPYGYVGGNSESRTDPTGNHPVCNDFGGGCGAGSSSGEAATPSKAGKTSTPHLTLPPWMVTALQSIGSPHFITPTIPMPPAPPAPPKSKPYDIHQPAGGCGSAGIGAICPNTGANLALHLEPFSVGIPTESSKVDLRQ